MSGCRGKTTIASPNADELTADNQALIDFGVQRRVVLEKRLDPEIQVRLGGESGRILANPRIKGFYVSQSSAVFYNAEATDGQIATTMTPKVPDLTLELRVWHGTTFLDGNEYKTVSSNDMDDTGTIVVHIKRTEPGVPSEIFSRVLTDQEEVWSEPGDCPRDRYEWNAPAGRVEVDLDVDSDNDNGTGAPERNAEEEAIEETSPGKIVCYRGDLVQMKLSAEVTGVSGSLELWAVSGGAFVRVWESAAKGVEVVLPKTYAVGALPETLYVEGYDPGEARLALEFLDPAGVGLSSDTVVLSVLNIEKIGIVSGANAIADGTATPADTDVCATIKGTGEVLLEADLDPDIPEADIPAGLITWSGGDPVTGHPLQRKVSKSAWGKTTVKVKCCASTDSAYTMLVYVIGAEPTGFKPSGSDTGHFTDFVCDDGRAAFGSTGNDPLIRRRAAAKAGVRSNSP